ncbi:MAG TPA: hypothetical protein VK604_06875 [Bryobacteraceae bacterium]|nr:hypothetical protein [Bryobacteraceae bacterium]HTF66195.1 hypothetical protein [Edaphobacter sp.]
MLEHTLNVSLTLPGLDAKSDTYAAVQVILNAHQANHLPGLYKLIPEADSIDVIPEQVLNRRGSTVSVTPVMGTHITFPYGKRSVMMTLQLICDLVSQASHTNVILFSGPPPFEKVELQASD